MGEVKEFKTERRLLDETTGQRSVHSPMPKPDYVTRRQILKKLLRRMKQLQMI
jgi:hypothetical protein